MKFKYRMLGVVTLYNPQIEQAAANIRLYAGSLDKLVVWDNSSFDKAVKQQLLPLLSDLNDKMIWHGTGENLCIAKAINYSWRTAKEHDCQFLLIMDQDSQWDSFASYRAEIERRYDEDAKRVYTPYFPEHDTFESCDGIVERRTYINSGTVMPIELLDIINGADEALPLDALDTDLSYRTLKADYRIACLANCVLHHTIGSPQRGGPFHLFTNNYGRFRTYSMTRGHIICYRKHRDIMTCYEKRKFFKEIFMWKLIRIILVEEDKWGRFRMMLKGIKEGVTYKLK